MVRVSAGLLIMGVSVALAAFACAGSGAPAQEGQTSPESTPAEQWALSLAQEGGIAGMHRTAAISSTGQAVFRDRRSGQEVSTTLTERELRELSALIASGSLLSQKEDQRTPACRDCFTYTLDARLGDRSRHIVADDQGLAEDLRPLIEWLVERTNRAL